MSVEDFYDRQTYDFYKVKGDTIFLKLEFFDSTNTGINISQFGIKFTLRDPITDLPIMRLQKTRDGYNTVPVINGIYTLADTPGNLGMGLTGSNQIVVHLLPVESNMLDKEIYPFDVEFLIKGVYEAVFTQKGHLILNRDVTPNV